MFCLSYQKVCHLELRAVTYLVDIIDNLNSMLLPANASLVSFDTANMFPNIDNKSGLDALKSILLRRPTNTPPIK